MDEQKDSRKTYRKARSALRFLLRRPEIGPGIEQFKRVEFRGTSYIYNTRANNIIATIQHTSKGWVVRYRPTSHYADILRNYKKYIEERATSASGQSRIIFEKPKVHVLPSYRLSHMQRRIARWASPLRSYSLLEATMTLGSIMGKKTMANHIVLDWRAARLKEAIVRSNERLSSSMLENFIRQSTPIPVEGNVIYNEARMDTSTFGTTFITMTPSQDNDEVNTNNDQDTEDSPF